MNSLFDIILYACISLRLLSSKNVNNEDTEISKRDGSKHNHEREREREREAESNKRATSTAWLE